MPVNNFVWICTNEHCGRSYPEDGYGLTIVEDQKTHDKHYVCACGGQVALHEIKRKVQPTTALDSDGAA